MNKIEDILEKLIKQKHLTIEESKKIAQIIFDENLSNEKITLILTLLFQKKETFEEIFGFVEYLKSKCKKITLEGKIMDTCGTGGDKANSFNISTFVSFLVASAGIPVIKHGNRSISSKCGSADLIEGIGIPLDAPLPIMRSSMEKLNYTFLFAPKFHPAFKHIAPVRKALAKEGIITIFNLLGPTINPAKPANQVLGVFDPT